MIWLRLLARSERNVILLERNVIPPSTVLGDPLMTVQDGYGSGIIRMTPLKGHDLDAVGVVVLRDSHDRNLRVRPKLATRSVWIAGP